MRTMVVALLAPCLLLAADVTGKWTGTARFRDADDASRSTPAVLNLKQDGQKVTGTAGPAEDQQRPIDRKSVV